MGVPHRSSKRPRVTGRRLRLWAGGLRQPSGTRLLTSAPTVFISGVHSGPNPSPGVGTARAVREAFPDAHIVAVDYSARSSGLHDRVFDATWVVRPWRELDLSDHVDQIRTRLASDGYWLSGLDLETRWLASGGLGSQERFLLPPEQALQATAKPTIAAASELGLATPPFELLSESETTLDRFCRFHGWRVWLKGPYYEARPVDSWPGLLRARDQLLATWHTTQLFLQAHVEGTEESIAYAALDGFLVGEVRLEKGDVTPEGKTWSGQVFDLDATSRERLARLVSELRWTGGAEVECVRDERGRLHAIDWNPRFPAWIFGAAIAGHNLPADLIAAANGGARAVGRPVSGAFTRVVYEIPARFGVLSYVSGPTRPTGKHPSGMPELAHRLSDKSRTRGSPRRLEASLDSELVRVRSRATPTRVLLHDTASRRLLEASNTAKRLRPQDGPEVRFAYSVKTDPDARLLDLAHRNGFLAECISQDEAGSALAAGWSVNDLVLNGPGKGWGRSQVVSPDAVRLWFCDSIEEVSALVREDECPLVVGVRLRLPDLPSRFGVPLDDFDSYARLVHALGAGKQRALATHFHYPASVIGPAIWSRAAAAVVDWTRRLEEDTGCPVTAIDFGGGWTPDQLDRDFEAVASSIIGRAQGALRRLETVVFEPGKALVQPTKVLVTRVLEVRAVLNGGRDAIVDGSIAELPDAWSFPRRVFWRSRGRWFELAAGPDRLLGRICMEQDVLTSGVDLPDSVSSGDLIAFADAGAYGDSMSYRFGRG